MSLAINHEYKFLTKIEEDLKCMICLEVARDPFQHEECGKLLCRTCLEQHGRHNPCPNCRKQKSQYYVDRRGKRSIDALEVTCNNAKRKCNWQGALGTLDAHLATCEFSLLPCSNNCQDDENKARRFTRKELVDHLKNDCPDRDFRCPDCGKEGKYSTITQEHEKVCAKKIVSCLNKDCIVMMPREKIMAHIVKECLHTPMPCKYRVIGCASKPKRCDLGEHEHDDKLHLRMVMDATLDFKHESIALKKSESFTFAVPNYQRALESDNSFQSLSFYNPQGYYFKPSIYPNGNGLGKGTHISAYINMKRGQYDSRLKWPFDGTITITLLNQHHDGHHHSLKLHFPNDQARAGAGAKYSLGFSRFIPHDKISNTTSTRQYLKNDTLYFRVSVLDNNYKPWLKCTTGQP